MKIIFLCNDYYWEGINRVQGGVQNYIWALSQHFSSQYNVVIWQKSKKQFTRKEGKVTIYGTGLQSFHRIISNIEKDSDPDSDILIFASHYFIVKNKFRYSIAIQHGIAWDVTDNNTTSFLGNIIDCAKGLLRAIKTQLLFNHCKNIVCVDYNFINWYRTQFKHLGLNYAVIPNFSLIPDYTADYNKDRVRIVFARRLEPYRGTRIFIDAILPLLDKYSFLSITIAGYGSDLDYLKDRVKNYPNVCFTAYKSDESICFHKNHDIAVVPSLGSEGTSLSLLEAMAAGCAVVSTNVGGITNIILDGYNGLLVNPNSQQLSEAIEKLIVDENLRNNLSRNAYETVASSFSFDKWISSWYKLINNITRE